MGRIVLLVTLSSLLGCSKGADSENPFVTGYTGQVPSGDTDDGSTGGGDTDDPTTGISGANASATGDGSTSTSGAAPGSTSSASTDPTVPTTDPTDPSTSGDGSTSVASDDDGSTSNGDGGGQNGQPPTGMYSHCIIDQYDNCINGATTCIYVEAPDDGYCSSSGCLNPAVDCDPAPADGTATPVCMSAGADSFCALDCSVGTCPAGMVCKGVTFDMVTNYDICM